MGLGVAGPEGSDFKCGFAMVSLWRHKHFDPTVLTDAG